MRFWCAFLGSGCFLAGIGRICQAKDAKYFALYGKFVKKNTKKMTFTFFLPYIRKTKHFSGAVP